MGGEEGREPQETQASPERFGRRVRARARRPPARPGLLSPPPQAPPDSRTSTGRERPCPSWTDPRTATEARAVLPGAAAAAGPRAPSAAGGRRGANSEAPQRRGRPLSLAPPPRYLHVRRRGSMAPGPRSALRPGPRGCHGDGPLCGQGGAGARGSNGPAPDGRGGGGEREGRGGGGRGAGRPPHARPAPPVGLPRRRAGLAGFSPGLAPPPPGLAPPRERRGPHPGHSEAPQRARGPLRGGRAPAPPPRTAWARPSCPSRVGNAGPVPFPGASAPDLLGEEGACPEPTPSSPSAPSCPLPPSSAPRASGDVASWVFESFSLGFPALDLNWPHSGPCSPRLPWP